MNRACGEQVHQLRLDMVGRLGCVGLLAIAALVCPCNAREGSRTRSDSGRLIVSSGILADSVEPIRTRGSVRLPSGAPAAGAVILSSHGEQVVARDDGSFEIELLRPRGDAPIAFTAAATVNGTNHMAQWSETIDQLRARDFVAEIELQESSSCSAQWLPIFGQRPGINGVSVYAFAVYDDGSGPALHVGGDFSGAGGVSVSRIAKWNGERWSAVGLGVSGPIAALAVYDDGGPGGPMLYAGGGFTFAAGQTVNNIARWNGNTWSGLGNGTPGGSVSALAVMDDGTGPSLYVGGSFTVGTGGPANRIARWSGSAWSALGSGISGTSVNALLVRVEEGGPALYAGGLFTAAGGVAVGNIARWKGGQWSALGSGVSGGAVYSLADFDDESGGGAAVHAGGSFEIAGGETVNYVAKWDGSQWSALGVGIENTVRALAVFDDGTGRGPVLVAGGGFIAAGGAYASAIAQWDGSAWTQLGEGVSFAGSTDVRAMCNWIDENGAPILVVGGDFPTAGGFVVNGVANWNGEAWSELGSGLKDSVTSFAVFDDGSGDGAALHLGGAFLSASGVELGGVTKWSNGAWHSLDGGVGGGLGGTVVNAMKVFDDGGGPALFVGGDFTTAGGVPANRIARWNGEHWSPLGTGVNGGSPPKVYALEAFDDGSASDPALYVGGDFSSAGGVTGTKNLAKWDGRAWSSVGGGTGSFVSALAVLDDRSGAGPALFVGGHFQTVGSISASRIAKWNGRLWSTLGIGLGSTVLALQAVDDPALGGPALFAGGEFTTAGGSSANRIARWDGSFWWPLGTGTNGSVAALSVFDDGAGEGAALYVGGSFTTAGGGQRNRIARWNGAEWSSVGSGMSSKVSALHANSSLSSMPRLFAGGAFYISPAGDSFAAERRGCAPPCAADIDGDELVDGFDIGELLGVWGQSGPSDLDGNGTTDEFDLDVLFTSWGPCSG